VTIVVSLPLQRAYIYRNGVPIGVTTVSTGKDGYSTPTGVFTILQKEVVHRSNKYDDAPMPYMQRLTWEGVALHAGNIPGYPASHGCIRLPADFARALYGVTSRGATVVVTDEAVTPEVAPSVLDFNFDIAADQARAFYWAPERSPRGPVSIVVSGHDRRLVVLRNGIRIGEAAISSQQPIVATAAYTLQSVAADGLHWAELPLPGMAALKHPIPRTDTASAAIPSEFRAQLLSILEPGATLLITRDTLATGGLGQRLRVLETALAD
jgi:hypothetical protein